MSALASSYVPLNPKRSELAATRELSRAASNAVRYERGLEAVSSIALSIPGIWRISIETPPELADLLSFDRIGYPAEGNWSTARASIEAGRHKWGELSVYFELSSALGENAVQFTRFVAQQIGGMLDRIALRQQRETSLHQISILRGAPGNTESRVTGCGLIARRDNVSLKTA